MNSPDRFEERLARIPFRPPPASLREQVMRATRQASPPQTHRAAIRGWVWQWLWPHPAAWGTLGLAWLAVLCLNLAALENPTGTQSPRARVRVSSAWSAALREQRALLQTLLQDSPPTALPPAPDSGALLWAPRRPLPGALA